MWWCRNAVNSTHPVGLKEPNPYGLFDVHGNVWEWCEDVYNSDFYATHDAAGPNPIATSGSGSRVMRGGSRGNGASRCRSAGRFMNFPQDTGNSIGFRPVFFLPP